jgi:hypothetical protein
VSKRKRGSYVEITWEELKEMVKKNSKKVPPQLTIFWNDGDVPS